MKKLSIIISSLCLAAILLTCGMFTASAPAVAEGLLIEDEVPAWEANDELLVDEYIDMELPLPEGEYAVEAAPLEESWTDESETDKADDQAVMSPGLCNHLDSKWLDISYDFKIIDCQPLGKFNHVITYSLSGQYKLICDECGQVFNSAIPTMVYAKTRVLCSFNYLSDKKCSDCKQKKSTCKHKKYHSIGKKLYGYDDILRYSDCLYFDADQHVAHVYIADGIDGFCICDDCRAFAEMYKEGQKTRIYWCNDDPDGISLSAVAYQDYELQPHNYVNGVCTGCGHIRDIPSVTLVASDATLGRKETEALFKGTIPAGVKFYSSNEKIVAVNASTGKATAKKTGTAKVKAKYKGIPLAECKITVKNAPGKVTLNKSKATLTVGDTLALKASIPKDTFTSKYTWSSDKKDVATVDANGVVTAKKKGRATITVKTTNGKKAKCKVTVKAPGKYTELKDYIKQVNLYNYCRIRGSYYSDEEWGWDKEILKVYGNVFEDLRRANQDEGDYDGGGGIYMKGKYVSFEAFATGGGFTLTSDAPYSLFGFHAGMSIAEARENAKKRSDIKTFKDSFIINDSKTTYYYWAMTTMTPLEVSVRLYYDKGKTVIDRIGLMVFCGD